MDRFYIFDDMNIKYITNEMKIFYIFDYMNIIYPFSIRFAFILDIVNIQIYLCYYQQ